VENKDQQEKHDQDTWNALVQDLSSDNISDVKSELLSSPRLEE